LVRVRKRGEKIRQFILDNVSNHPKDIASLTAKAFDISRQAVNKHVKHLEQQKALLIRGTTRSRHYVLLPLEKWDRVYPTTDSLKEDLVWRNDIRPRLGELPDNIIDIWQYGFTEMLNNAIDHSGSKNITVILQRTATETEIAIHDYGEGIFRKIQRELNLEDERHAVLELSKGKVTTDPRRHTGEGIFFTSRMFDDFAILSGSTYFSHIHDEVEDWILQRQNSQDGTSIFMKLRNNNARTTKAIFDQFTSGGDYGFTKTVLPVRLAQYGDEKLISRSQAKRLMARVERFKVVMLDFDGVESIGQAFADEVFRVFISQHPLIEVVPTNTVPAVRQMIDRSRSNQLATEG